MALTRPQINIHHRTKTNRNGKHYQVRTGKYVGYIKVDRKTQEWAYCEVRKALSADGLVDRAVTIVTSPGWADYMDSMKPDHVMYVTPAWATKISLRERARH